ncbi:SirZ, zinc finger transcriptional regulator, partial [Metarhizium majus ARSEF 297]
MDGNNSVLSVEEQFATDTSEHLTDADWERPIAGTGAERLPRVELIHGDPDHPRHEAGHEPKSSSQQKSQAAEEGRRNGQNCTFNCFKRLASHLGDLNTMERQPNMICLDVTPSHADMVIGCAHKVLECYSWRLDTKVLLMLMTALQTVLNWVRVEYTSSQQGDSPCNLPAILFGSWKVPKEDGYHIMRLLTRRILATCQSAIKVLRFRLDEIALDTSRGNLTYQLLDVESPQNTLQRLASSLKQLMEVIKEPSHERDVNDMIA